MLKTGKQKCSFFYIVLPFAVVVYIALRQSTNEFKVAVRKWEHNKTESHLSSDSWTLNESCSRLLSKHINSTLNGPLITEMEKICLQKSIGMNKMPNTIFDKDLLDRSLTEAVCPKQKTKFANEAGPFVALASFPGSGNSWTRSLLETITGVYTGSIYTDGITSFPGSRDSPCELGVFIVKTHKSSDQLSRCPNGTTFSKAIFILRNPYDAAMSSYNRQNSRSMVDIINPSLFQQAKWSTSAKRYSGHWKALAEYWLTIFDRPVHLLVYEALKKNTMLEMYKLMTFLERDITLRRLYCLVKTFHEEYHRIDKPSWLNKAKLFDNETKTFINANIEYVYNVTRQANPKYKMIFLKQYILPLTQ